MPHRPQLRGSVCVLVHAPPHMTSPEVQPHTPPLHEAPGAHAALHAPQLFASVLVLVHVPLQTCSPEGQAQAPAWQVVPAVHALPQDPQLLESDERSVQAPLQSAGLLPPAQLHALETHCSPPAQAVVQEPQWPGSLARLTHEPLQFVVPAGHWKKHEPT